MSELILKYKLLDDFAQQEVRDFIDFLIQKNKKKEKKSLAEYKKKILEVSV